MTKNWYRNKIDKGVNSISEQILINHHKQLVKAMNEDNRQRQFDLFPAWWILYIYAKRDMKPANFEKLNKRLNKHWKGILYSSSRIVKNK